MPYRPVKPETAIDAAERIRFSAGRAGGAAGISSGDMKCPCKNQTLFPVAVTLLFSVICIAKVQAQQAPPFNGLGGATAFDPEISVVYSGAISDVQVVASDDRRYVTINARPDSTGLARLNVFQAAQMRAAQANAARPLRGFVGDGGLLADDVGPGVPPAMAAPAGPRLSGSPVNTSPAGILRANPGDSTASILREPGMFRLTRNRPSH